MCSGFWPVRRDLALSCYSFRRRPGAVIEAGLGAGPAPSAYPFPRYSGNAVISCQGSVIREVWALMTGH